MDHIKLIVCQAYSINLYNIVVFIGGLLL